MRFDTVLRMNQKKQLFLLCFLLCCYSSSLALICLVQAIDHISGDIVNLVCIQNIVTSLGEDD